MDEKKTYQQCKRLSPDEHMAYVKKYSDAGDFSPYAPPVVPVTRESLEKSIEDGIDNVVLLRKQLAKLQPEASPVMDKEAFMALTPEAQAEFFQKPGARLS
jgi:hypothetical protein